MPKTLLIFADGLPYYCLNNMNFTPRFFKCHSLEPGFGYSINIHAEIFGGYSPDDLGYLNRWSYAPAKRPSGRLRTAFSLFPILKYLCSYDYLDALIRRILSLRWSVLNMPLNNALAFRGEGIYIHREDFPRKSLFTEFPDTFYALVKPGENDHKRFERALEATESARNIIVYFVGLDQVSHQSGVGSSEYTAKLQELDQLIETLSEVFLHRNPKGTVLLLSDHGMANVKKGISLELESTFGKSHRAIYYYFLDSTMMRVWIFDSSIRYQMLSYLKAKEFGRIVSEEERAYFGITSKKFGDYIFLLHKGYVFYPDTIGHDLPKAMHGYDPRCESQTAVLATLPNLNDRARKIKRSRDVHGLLKELLSSG